MVNQLFEKIVKELEISKEGEEVLKRIVDFLYEANEGYSEIQVRYFVLNDVEFPTLYAKFQQAKTELAHRCMQLVDLYFDMKKLLIKLQMKEREFSEVKDELRRELISIEIEKLKFQVEVKKIMVNRLLREVKLFWNVCVEAKEYFNLTPEQKYRLELEAWAKKAENMPCVFEERYGEEFLKKAWGEEKYQKFLEIRRNSIGILQRELMQATSVDEDMQVGVLRGKGEGASIVAREK